MSNRDKMIFQLNQQMAIYDNLKKTAELCSGEWEKGIIEKNASNLLTSIKGLQEVLETIKD